MFLSIALMLLALMLKTHQTLQWLLQQNGNHYQIDEDDTE